MPTYMRRTVPNVPNVPNILDAKRGDTGATAKQYAIEAFDRYGTVFETCGQRRVFALPHLQPRR